MCGICGFNWEDKPLLREMTNIMEHRGPDQAGFHIDDDISVGHRRLSIIDVSEAGRMPMFNEDGSILIIFNGEIYNFKELRAELEKEKHRFSSHSDTETILHGYEQWGEKVVERLNGEFAFCIYDIPHKKMFLARDRLGIKPLYYYFNEGKFIFASEIKPLLLAGIPREVNVAQVREYLNLRYIPGEETLFTGIKKLLPGHTLTLSEGKMIITRFWDVPIPQIKKITLVEAGKEVQELLADSVQRRLIADVPIGIYLSGGIDSAAITALASQNKTKQVKTFSVGFDYNEEVDELNQAQKIARFFSTDHKEIVVDEPITPLLPKILWHLDQPHGDPVIIPNFKLSQLASKTVKVVLSGEGADEMYAGYVQYKNYVLAQKAKLIPGSLKATLVTKTPVKMMDTFFDYPSMGEVGREKVADFFRHAHNQEQSYVDLTSIMSEKEQNSLFTDTLQHHKPPYGSFPAERKPLLNQLLYYDLKKWLPNYPLHISDRMTLAHSIEGRVPFLDHRLVEQSMSYPANFKVGNSITKVVLRQAMKNILPNYKTKKHPFFMPLDKWYNEELKGLAEQLFTPASVKERGYFNYEQLKYIWEKYPQSKLLYGKQLFTIINLELWQRMFIDAEKIPKNNHSTMSSLL